MTPLEITLAYWFGYSLALITGIIGIILFVWVSLGIQNLKRYKRKINFTNIKRFILFID